MTLQGTCWVITDHAAGNQRQALALAGCWDMPTRHLVVDPRRPWSWFAPRLTWAGRFALERTQRDALTPPWPQVAVGCGRQAALCTRMLRQWSAGACHAVQILDPRADPANWDSVIAPRHDRLEGANVLTTLGSLNPVDDAWLQAGRTAWPRLGDLPRPRVGVLLGGPRKGMALDATYAQHLMRDVLGRQRVSGGSVLLLASRRTPATLVALCRRLLAGIPGLLWAGAADGDNPYAGVLGWADELVVTPDSVNMLSEACAVGCPVRTLVTTPLPPRIARFHHALAASGLIATNADAPPPAHAPLRETAATA
ncbi:MAG: mitochondrial fission ELM1 family protein, partial [Rhodanobacter sp.]